MKLVWPLKQSIWPIIQLNWHLMGMAHYRIGYVCVSHHQLIQSQRYINISHVHLQGVCGRFVFRKVFMWLIWRHVRSSIL